MNEIQREIRLEVAKNIEYLQCSVDFSFVGPIPSGSKLLFEPFLKVWAYDIRENLKSVDQHCALEEH